MEKWDEESKEFKFSTENIQGLTDALEIVFTHLLEAPKVIEELEA